MKKELNKKGSSINFILGGVVLIIIALLGLGGYYWGSSNNTNEDFFDGLNNIAYGTIKEINGNSILMDANLIEDAEVFDLTVNINEDTKIVKYDLGEINENEEFDNVTEIILELNDLKIGDLISLESVKPIKGKTEIDAVTIILENIDNI